MSIPIQFGFYNKEGDLLEIRSLFTMSYGSNVSNLTEMIRRLHSYSTESLGSDVKYIVPINCTDYMIDVDCLALMPNKFKK